MERFKLFNKEYNDALTLVMEYEKLKSFETAYLIKWQLIERTIKEIAKVVRKDLLTQKLYIWLDYLKQGDGKIKPADIKNFSIDSNKLPEISLLTEYFKKELPYLREVLNPNGKCRKRRNLIAHNFEAFAKEETYRGYSEKLDLAINELSTNLNKVSN